MASAAVDLKAKLLARALEFLTLVDCVDDRMLRAFQELFPGHREPGAYHRIIRWDVDPTGAFDRALPGRGSGATRGVGIR
jgi:hypothetical protein